MAPDWRNAEPPLDGADALLRNHSHASEQFAQPRPTTGSRKRKAYMPRNSGYDEAASNSGEQLNSKKRATGTKAVRPSSKTAVEAAPGQPTVSIAGAPLFQPPAQSTDYPPSSPVAGSSKARSRSGGAVADVQRCGSGSSSAAAAPTVATVQAGSVAVESLATTRSRRVIKRREKFDPHMFELSGDLDEAEESRSDNSSETLSRRSCYPKSESEVGALVRVPTSDSAAASGGVPSPRAWLSALVSGMPKASGGRASESSTGTSDEQRMFQEFRKRTCTAYTGVVVHCQNMKLEARVNMVSYFPERERKISGGQIYIAYMTNPHQAAVVHDITASIMTAPGIPIYHNHHCRPSTNREVALERLNYLDTLAVNMHRGYSRNNDKDQLLEKKARLDAENRRQVMLSPEALKRELHCWVSHDSRWLTFKSWIEDVLFESKLANMCLKPKTIDSSYLKPEEQELLQHWAPEFSMANPPVFTHMYDTLVMDRIMDASGNLCGYKLRAKRYRRRKPEVRNGAVKWFDDKSYRCDLEDVPTEEDQQRVDIAWGVVCRWLRHYDPALQGPPPDYDAVDANYYVTWGHFADWVNTLLEHMPREIEVMQKDASCATPERSTSTRRSARNGDSQALKDRIRRLQAVHDKFRGVVAEGECMPSTWSQAKPEHRRAFENFFSGWKPLPPSMSQLQRRAPTRAGGDCGYRSSRRAANARNDTAPQTRSASANRSQPLRDRCPSAATLPSSSAFTNATAEATRATSKHIATMDPYATPTSPAIPPEATRGAIGDCAANGAATALQGAVSLPTVLHQNSASQSVALPHPLLPWNSQPLQDATMHTVPELMQRTASCMATSVPLSAATGQGQTVGQHPRLTVASLTGISPNTNTAAAKTGAASTSDHVQSLPQQKLKVASGVLASMAGIHDVAGLQAWATMHGLGSAVPAVSAGKGASHAAAMRSAPQAEAVAPSSTMHEQYGCGTAAQGGNGMLSSAPAVQQPPMQMCDLQQVRDLHQLMRLQAHLQSPQVRASMQAAAAQQRPQEQTHQQQVPKAALNDALAALNLPNGLFSSQPQQFSHPSTTAPNSFAPGPTLSPPTAPSLSGPTQLAPRPLVLPPSPFLTALEHPNKPPTIESLFQGSGSGKSNSSNSGSGAGFPLAGGAPAENNSGANAATTATALHHPTLSSLLSNPLFAMPSAAQAARGGGDNGSNPSMQAAPSTTFARQFSCGK